MTTPTKEERLAAKHAFFRKDFDAIQTAVRDVRIQCLSDRRFYSIPGAQWEGPVGEQFENKPRFEFNKTHLAVLGIINEYRNNRVTVDFVPKDGSQADDLADTCDGLFRADEQDSGAQEAYDNCFEEGTAGGMGAIRLRARYEDEDDDEDDRQRIAIEPIYEADTCVFFSRDGKRYDKADAKRCYVLTAMSPGDYEDEYGDSPASWPKGITQAYFDWATPDVVWVAEVYEVEQQSELIHFFRGIALDDSEPNELELTDDELAGPGKLEELTATGFREVRQKRVERCQGHVRLARDAQVLDNMLKSWLADMAARFDVEKPILTPEQIASHTTMWAEDAVKKLPYLLINPITDANGQQVASGPIGYTKAPNLPPAMAALAQMAATALEDMLGNQQAGEQLQPNQSGKVVELIQNRLDMQVFIYMDNFRKTVKRMGEVWISMAKELLVEPGRNMKIIDRGGESSTIELLKPMVNKESGERYEANDLSKAKFDVGVDVAPSSSSRRAATVRALTCMMQMTADLETQLVLSSTALLNMEGEGLTDLRPYFRQRLLRLGALKPTVEEKQELKDEQANQTPDPNAEYLQAAARKAAADEQLATAKVGETHAKTIQTLAKVESGQQADLIALADSLTPGPIQDARAAPVAAPAALYLLSSPIDDLSGQQPPDA